MFNVLENIAATEFFFFFDVEQLDLTKFKI